MKVSIIIPVFNTNIKYLNECFESIQNQSETDFETIIIDDGSKAEIAQYLDIWMENDNRFRVIHTQNKGVSAARNRGIKEAGGKWITFVDSDDYLEQDTLKIVLKIAEDSMSDIVMWRFDKDYNGIQKETIFVGEKELIFEGQKIEQIERMLLNFYKYGSKMQFTFLPTTICKLYRSDIIKSNEIIFCENVQNGEDAIFSLEAVHYAKKIFVKDIILYHYRYVEGSASMNSSPKVLNSWIQNRKELKRVLYKIDKFFEYEEDYNYHALEILKILLFTVIIKVDTKEGQIQNLKSLMSEEVFGKCIDSLHFNNVYGVKGKIILFLAKRRLYILLLLLTKIRATMITK